MNKKLKLLLYCDKIKPYLLKHPNNEYRLSNHIDYSNEFEDGYFTGIKSRFPVMNGKIVLECDYELEKIELKMKYMGLYYCGETVNGWDGSLCEESQLDNWKLLDYLGDKIGNKGYAIHIKNLKLIEPRELESSCYYDPKNNYKMIKKDYKKNNCYMRIICLSEPGNPEFVFFPVTSKELYEILIGKKTVIIRKRVLKEMK